MSLGYSIDLAENNDDDDDDDDNDDNTNNHYLVSTYFLDNVVCFTFIAINSFDDSVITCNLFVF